MQLRDFNIFISFFGVILFGVIAFAADGDFHGAISATNINFSGVATGNGSGLSNLTIPSPTLTMNNSVSRSLVSSTSSTGFQIHATKKANVVYTVKISVTASIGNPAEGEVYLETAATNSTTPGDWTTVSRIGNGQGATLAALLSLTQPITIQLQGMIPAGYYIRLRTNNVSGTPTYTYIMGQETLI